MSEELSSWFVIAFRVLLRAAEGELAADGETQKAALLVLCNCVCSPRQKVWDCGHLDKLSSTQEYFERGVARVDVGGGCLGCCQTEKVPDKIVPLFNHLHPAPKLPIKVSLIL